MKYRLQLTCVDCHLPGVNNCRDGDPAFVTDHDGTPLEFDTEEEAQTAQKHCREAMDVRVLSSDGRSSWGIAAPAPKKKKSFLD